MMPLITTRNISYLIWVFCSTERTLYLTLDSRNSLLEYWEQSYLSWTNDWSNWQSQILVRTEGIFIFLVLPPFTITRGKLPTPLPLSAMFSPGAAQLSPPRSSPTRSLQQVDDPFLTATDEMLQTTETSRSTRNSISLMKLYWEKKSHLYFLSRGPGAPGWHHSLQPLPAGTLDPSSWMPSSARLSSIPFSLPRRFIHSCEKIWLRWC